MIERAPESLRHPLRRQHQRFNRALLVRHVLEAAAGCAALVALATLIGAAFATGTTGAWLRLTGLVALATAVTTLAVRAYLRERLGLDPYLERVEARFPALRSLIRNAIDFEAAPRRHESEDLAGAVRNEAARRLTDAPLGVLTPSIQARRPVLLMAAGLATVVLLGVLWPGATARSWSTLWNPAAAAPPVRLVVEPGSVTITPGSSLAVRARVWGTAQAPRLDRDGSSSGRSSVVAVAEGGDDHGGRVWRFDLAQLTQAQDYWVKVAAARSPRYHIGMAGHLAPVSFEVEYHSPSYARMPVQRGTAARGDLTALRGSVAELVVTFDRDLDQLQATGPDGRPLKWTALTPRRWKGRVPMSRDGEYELVARAERSADEPAPEEGRFRYRVTALADAPPVLVVQVPQSDLDLPAGQQVPVDVLAQDDLGLTELTLETRKDPSAPWQPRRLARFNAEPREARVETRWDASSLGLLPGETATFRFVLYDDNAVSGRGQTVSPTFELRFPSLADLYEGIEEHQSGAQKKLEKVAEETKELQKSLDKLTRQQPRQEQSPSSFERSEELRSTLERQTQVSKQIQEAAEELRQSLDQAAERNAFDRDLMEKLRQMTELMQQIESPEFKDALRKMQQALENMDRRQLERNLPEWRQQNQNLMKNLERTLELLKKLREEEKVQALAQKTRDLKARQDALNQEHGDLSKLDRPKTQDLAQRQKDAGQESKELGKEAAEMAKQAEQSQQQQQMNEAAETLDQQAAQAQQQAAESAEKQQQQSAQQSGQQASEALSKAADKLQQAAQSMQQEQQQLDLAAVRRAAQDLVSLQRSSENNLQSNSPTPEKADRQTDLSEGASRVADSLYQLSRETPFISPRLAEAMGRAISQMQSSGKEFAGGDRGRGEEAGQRALQSLNQAVRELRQTESSMCDRPGNNPGGRSNPQQIGELGQRQSQLNQETRSLTERLSEQMRLSAGDRDEMRRMAEEQARIREQLEQIQREDETKRELLGRLDKAQDEMRDVEEVLRQGAMSGELEEKQQRILSRLLDAQRSVNRRDFDPQRESRVGEDVVRRSPGEIPAELMRQSDRFRQDLLKSELDRYPAQYRAFVEAYLRSLNGSRR